MVLATIQGFFAFSLAASTIYIINDIRDREEDRLHPEKCHRPIPAGKISTGQALIIAFFCLAGGLALSYFLAWEFQLLLLTYIAMQIVYTFGGKRIVILDTLTIALGFVLRVVAGAAIIHVPVSSWLLLCTFFLALFLAFCKRRHELATLDEATRHRKVLGDYTLPFLDQMITMATAATILCYALYVTSPSTQVKFHSPYLIATIPFVVYGIARYLYLLHNRDMGGNPTDVLMGDGPFAINVLLWIAASILIVYTG